MNAVYELKVQNDDFHGKRVLVTGGSKGIGAALVQRFHMGGGRVAATGRTLPPEGSDASLFVNTTALKIYDGLKHIGDETDARYLAHLLHLGILPTGAILRITSNQVKQLDN
ncbi:MAG: hypothetical protein WCA85_29030 [Paraburkholderia sp.]|uniref:hypothetical protein n=1 Tax=Paraburkholderia sp. TaxID=1926495 RepID=UPI003C3DBE99